MSARTALPRSGTAGQEPGHPGASGSTALAPPRPRRRRWVRVLVVLLVVALLATGGWLVGFSSVLAARTVSVTGVRTLSADEVRTAARVPLGVPLARQNVGAIGSRVRTIRVVSSVTVTRTWPRTVSIVVTERTPVLAVRQPDGFVLIDATGTWYLTVPTVPAGVVLADVDPTNTPLLTQLAVVASALPDGLKGKVYKFTALSRDGIRLELKDGDVAVWGDSSESKLKSEVLTALLKRKATTYDVSAPHSPALR